MLIRANCLSDTYKQNLISISMCTWKYHSLKRIRIRDFREGAKDQQIGRVMQQRGIEIPNAAVH